MLITEQMKSLNQFIEKKQNSYEGYPLILGIDCDSRAMWLQ